MQDLVVNARLTIPADALQISHSRSSGPGGQNVNKVNSRVTLRFDPTRCAAWPDDWRRRFVARHRSQINNDGELLLHSERHRQQHRNLADVRQRLVSMLVACQSPPKKRKATRPSRGSQERRLKRKKERSDKKRSRSARFSADR